METISIKETITREVEVSFPLYRKTICHYFYIISKTEMIQTTISSLGNSNQHYKGRDITKYILEEESNSTEFFLKYQQVQTELNEIVGL